MCLIFAHLGVCFNWNYSEEFEEHRKEFPISCAFTVLFQIRAGLVALSLVLLSFWHEGPFFADGSSMYVWFYFVIVGLLRILCAFQHQLEERGCYHRFV